MASTHDDSFFIAPELQRWFDNLSEAGKEKYRKLYAKNSALESQQSLDAPLTVTSDVTVKTEDIPRVDRPLELRQNRVVTGAPNALAYVADQQDSPASASPHSLQSTNESTRPTQSKNNIPKVESNPHTKINGPGTSSVASIRTTPLTIPPSKPRNAQSSSGAEPNAPPLNNNLSVFSDRRGPSVGGKKIPLSLKRGMIGGLGYPPTKKPTIPAYGTPGKIDSPSNPIPAKFDLPEWHRVLQVGPRSLCSRETLARLMQIRDRMDKCAAPGATANSREQQFQLIRTDIHVYEYSDVDEVLIKKSKLLEYMYGLPRLFSAVPGGVPYPFDISADAEALYNKWRRHDFDPDLMRGIDYRKKKGKNDKSRVGSALIPDYPNRIRAGEFGDNDLVNGQWWPILLAALRDGAHGAAQAGIHGAVGQGAYSILVSGSHYADKDDGETLRYCGTEGGEDGGLTDATKCLHDNIKNRNPVRVLRTSKLPPENPYRPSLGYRYDGLYDVISFEVLDASKGHQRFLLKRCDNQAPIRCKPPYARPSPQDIEAFENNKDLMKGL